MADTRETLQSQMHSLKLAASIAFDARNHDLAEFMQDVIDLNGLSSFAAVTPTWQQSVPANSTALNLPCIVVKLNLEEDQSHNPFNEPLTIMFTFTDDDDVLLDMSSSICELGSRGINFYDKTTKALAAVNAFVKSVPEVHKFITSSAFKAYEHDIRRYVDAVDALNKFNTAAHDAKVLEVASSLKRGDVIKTCKSRLGQGNDVCFSVNSDVRKQLRWCGKLYYQSSITNYKWYRRRTIDRMFIANRVVDGEWMIADPDGSQTA